MEKIQKIGVSGFIYNKGRALILKRSEKEKFMPGWYDLPGGKVEFGEALEVAVIREVKEETNLVGKNPRPYATFSYVTLKNTRHTVDIQFVVGVNNISKLKITAAHDDYRWIKENEIKKYKISKEMGKAIKNGFKALNNERK